MSRQEKETTTTTTSGRPINPVGPETTTTTQRPVTTTVPPETTTGTTVSERSRVNEPVTWEEMRSLMMREPSLRERTWRPTVGGVLEILAGSWNLVLGIAAIIGGSFIDNLIPTFGAAAGDAAITGMAAGGFFALIGIIAIIGGIYALARRGWPIALAGSIVSLIPSPLILPFIMGIFSLIFNVLGHREFWAKSKGEID